MGSRSVAGKGLRKQERRRRCPEREMQGERMALRKTASKLVRLFGVEHARAVVTEQLVFMQPWRQAHAAGCRDQAGARLSERAICSSSNSLLRRWFLPEVNDVKRRTRDGDEA